MSGKSGLELLQARARAAPGPAGHRDDGALGPGQRRVRLRERRLRIPAQALRHRPGRGPGAPRRAGRRTFRCSPRRRRSRCPSCWVDAPAMQQVFRAIGRLSRSSVNVLVTGESGTGKELVARALHEHSPRANKAFIALNTSAIPGELLESELFGHEKGSFTGADALRRGRFEQADGGTLFLDEIGDMSLPLQTRLLRVLAEGEFYRVGGQTPIKVDVRVIAATHQNLEDRVANGPVPRGSVPPPERDPHRAAAAAPARRGRAGPARPLHADRRQGAGRRSQDAGRGCCRGTGSLQLARQRARTGEPVPATDGAGAGQRSACGRPAGRDHHPAGPRPTPADDWIDSLSAWARPGRSQRWTAAAG